MYQLTNDNAPETLKQISGKLKRKTPTKRTRAAQLQLGEQHSHSRSNIEEMFRAITLEDEMSNLDMIKERLNIKNKTIRSQTEDSVDIQLTKAKNKDLNMSMLLTSKPQSYEELETENIIQREQIQYLKRVNDIQRQEIEKLRNMLKKSSAKRLHSQTHNRSMDTTAKEQPFRQQLNHHVSCNEQIASSIKDLKCALTNAINRNKQRAKGKHSNTQLLQSLKKCRI